MERLKKMLHAGNFSCVIQNGEVTRCFTQRGVADLYRLLKEEPQFLHGAKLADKVIGKGAAALAVLGGIRQVYADVMSHPALALFRQYDIEAEAAEVVENIRNRRGDGNCPVETLCRDAATAEECLPLIEEFINRTNH